MNLRHYPISRELFELEIAPYISASKNRLGRPTKIDHYIFFCAVLYVLRTGIAWRDLPKFYGPWHTIYTRFKRWGENGLFWRLLHYLQQKKKQVRLDLAWIDSTTILVHRHGSGSLKKRGCNVGVEVAKD
jgi:transposase